MNEHIEGFKDPIIIVNEEKEESSTGLVGFIKDIYTNSDISISKEKNKPLNIDFKYKGD